MSRPTRKSQPTTHTPASGLRPNRAELDELISKVKDLVSQSPEKAALIISEWTRLGDQKPSSNKPAPKPAQAPVRRRA